MTWRPVRLSEVPDNAEVRVRQAYEVGLLARSKVAEMIAYGRALGLIVEHHHDGGWLLRTGYVVAIGEARLVRRWREHFNATFDYLAD